MHKISMEKRMTFRRHIITSVFLATLFLVSQCFAQSSQNNSNKDSIQYLQSLWQVFNTVQQNYVDEVDPKVLYEGALKGMMSSLGDPYTVYLDATDMRSMNDTTSGNFYGVGLSISKPVESTAVKPAYVDVVSPIQNTPGFKAGIQSGDKIIEIDGEPTPEMSMEVVLSKLRGERGAPVEVTILRGTSVTFKKTLIRDLIEVPTVEYGMIGKVGYVKLIQFTPETEVHLQEALDSFASIGYTGLIIDVRNNPGGLLDSAVNIADKFIDSGVIVSTKGRILGSNEVFNASKDKTTVKKGIPIIVLINKGSASASEILSGALKDHHLAYLVGNRTYGKGSVQTISRLPESNGIKLTIAKYYTPSDTNINVVGIPPDLEIGYPDYTDEENKEYLRLLESDEVAKTVAVKETMTETDIANSAKVLQAKYKLPLPLLRRLIRLEANRKKGSMLYDLDYDIQLNKALEILRDGKFSQLIRTTKTLKELQVESEAAEKTKTE